jgi:hypothetical protein
MTYHSDVDVSPVVLNISRSIYLHMYVLQVWQNKALPSCLMSHQEFCVQNLHEILHILL